MEPYLRPASRSVHPRSAEKTGGLRLLVFILRSDGVPRRKDYFGLFDYDVRLSQQPWRRRREAPVDGDSRFCMPGVFVRGPHPHGSIQRYLACTVRGVGAVILDD